MGSTFDRCDWCGYNMSQNYFFMVRALSLEMRTRALGIVILADRYNFDGLVSSVSFLFLCVSCFTFQRRSSCPSRTFIASIVPLAPLRTNLVARVFSSISFCLLHSLTCPVVIIINALNFSHIMTEKVACRSSDLQLK